MEPASLAVLGVALAAVCGAGYAIHQLAVQLERTRASLLEELRAERERHRDEIAELTNKIQYPQIYQPTPAQRQPQERPEPPDDEFELAGRDLGDVAGDGPPIPVGEAP